ncbi:helix-turn-helix transcriptional regulator [Parasphingorhabdus sp.]|uniref:helix-turn-helix transcriptional regulator n=1 Tax=Parasphingorhabdus sp. TaxID=2709688 RepID=UPI003C77A0E7
MKPMTSKTATTSLSGYNRELIVALAIVALQAIATIFFLIDSIDEIILQISAGIDFAVIAECLIAIALLAGVVLGARHTRKLMAEARRRESALAVARGALAEMLDLRFAEWQLSAGETDVALFAIKGCSVSEIAILRNTAAGTVRSQLSQIYAKAGVTSQSMLISIFIEELL